MREFFKLRGKKMDILSHVLKNRFKKNYFTVRLAHYLLVINVDESKTCRPLIDDAE